MKSTFYKSSIICLLSILLTGCTDSFEQMNKNPFMTTDVTPGFLIRAVLGEGLTNYGIWEYQVGDNLHLQFYAQYFAAVNTAFTTDRYGWQSSWVKDGFWYSYYSNTNRIRNEVAPWIRLHPEWDNMYQILRICDAMCAGRTTDLFGDIPYSEAGQGVVQPKFDSQKEIYYSIFKELREAVEALKKNTAQDTYTDLQDLFYAGDTQKWIKLANSLRLRFAMRISFIDPEKAKTEGEAALSDILMESNADNAGYMTTLLETPQGNPLYYIGNWSDFRASKTIIDILKNESSVADPRLPLWFGQTQGYAYGSYSEQYQGVPNGLQASQMGDEQYLAFNNSAVWGYYFNEEWNMKAPGSVTDGTKPEQIGVLRPLIAMNYAEVCFLKAEAALRGWSDAGEAKVNYENGIRASFEEFRKEISPSLYTAKLDEEYIQGGKVKWDEKGNFETKLKQIITQKWLGVYPNGGEAWSEFRRTGYPALTPVVSSDISILNEGEFIKKMPYVEEETDSNPNGLDPGLNQGQGDGQNVRVWWDTKRYK